MKGWYRVNNFYRLKKPKPGQMRYLDREVSFMYEGPSSQEIEGPNIHNSKEVIAAELNPKYIKEIDICYFYRGVFQINIYPHPNCIAEITNIVKKWLPSSIIMTHVMGIDIKLEIGPKINDSNIENLNNLYKALEEISKLSPISQLPLSIVKTEIDQMYETVCLPEGLGNKFKHIIPKQKSILQFVSPEFEDSNEHIKYVEGCLIGGKVPLSTVVLKNFFRRGFDPNKVNDEGNTIGVLFGLIEDFRAVRIWLARGGNPWKRGTGGYFRSFAEVAQPSMYNEIVIANSKPEYSLHPTVKKVGFLPGIHNLNTQYEFSNGDKITSSVMRAENLPLETKRELFKLFKKYFVNNEVENFNDFFDPTNPHTRLVETIYLESAPKEMIAFHLIEIFEIPGNIIAFGSNYSGMDKRFRSWGLMYNQIFGLAHVLYKLNDSKRILIFCNLSDYSTYRLIENEVCFPNSVSRESLLILFQILKRMYKDASQYKLYMQDEKVGIQETNGVRVHPEEAYSSVNPFESKEPNHNFSLQRWYYENEVRVSSDWEVPIQLFVTKNSRKNLQSAATRLGMHEYYEQHLFQWSRHVARLSPDLSENQQFNAEIANQFKYPPTRITFWQIPSQRPKEKPARKEPAPNIRSKL